MIKYRIPLFLFVSLLVLAVVFFRNARLLNNQTHNTGSGGQQVVNNYGKIPMSFEENRGQVDSSVKFLSRGNGYNLFLTPNDAVFAFSNSSKTDSIAKSLRLKLANAKNDPKLVGVDELQGKANYLIGKDPLAWKTGVSTFAKVKYQAVYSGVDLLFYGNKQQLEYDFMVSPGSDPRQIALSLNGIDSSKIDADGNLVLLLGNSEIKFQRPSVYQEEGGVRESVSGGYEQRENGLIGFQIGTYDTTRPLLIDPVLSYSTYLGGSGGDQSAAVAVDSAGNAYVTGSTDSLDFPVTAGIYQSASAGSLDIFVTKLNSTGTGVVYSTYIGGSGSDVGHRIVVDINGNSYIVGLTNSLNFPTLNALQPTYGGGATDNFLAKLNSSGSSLAFSTYLGGNGNDGDMGGLVLDVSGNIYVAGDTTSNNLPTTPNAIQSSYGGGNQDAYVAKVNPTATSYVFLTYLGGSDIDHGNSVGIDENGNVYVTGPTASSNFPVTSGAFQTTRAGGTFETYVAKLNPSGTGLIYSSFLGGSNNDFGRSITVDSSGHAYVTGSTTSSDFPTTPGVFQQTDQGSEDAFVTKVSPDGSTLIYSTYLGGSNEDSGTRLSVDQLGNAYIIGYTNSGTFFPVTSDAFQTIMNGTRDAFITKLNPTGTNLIYSTYIGGSNQEFTGGIAIDGTGNIYITGTTLSNDFPITANPYQSIFGGGASDGFVAKLRFNQPPVANAGADQTVVVKNAVTLNGSASFDPDLDQLAYLWSENAGNPQANVLSSTTVVSPTFTPQVAGAYQFSLVVNDGFVDSSPDTVVITVKTPAQAIQSLINLVEQLNLQQGIQNSLDAKLDSAQQALSDMNQNNNTSAINSLNSFISAVEAQRGNQITSAQADMLIQAAQAILNSLSN